MALRLHWKLLQQSWGRFVDPNTTTSFCVHQHILRHSCHTHLCAMFLCLTSCCMKPLQRIKWECPFPIDTSITIANWNIDFRYEHGLTSMLYSASCLHFRPFSIIFSSFFVRSFVGNFSMCYRLLKQFGFVLNDVSCKHSFCHEIVFICIP